MDLYDWGALAAYTPQEPGTGMTATTKITAQLRNIAGLNDLQAMKNKKW